MSTQETFEDFRARIDAAARAMCNGDARAWRELWSRAPDATLFGGWGGRERGHAELDARWTMVAGRYKSATIQIERITEHVTSDMAVTVEIQRGEAVFTNGSSGPIALRITHLCRREDGAWRLVHRHADEQLRLLPIESHIVKTP